MLPETPVNLMMADVAVERRKFSRKQVKLNCHLQMGAGVLVHGITRDVSQEDAMVEAQPLPMRQQNMTPKTGDMGLLILQYHKQGTPASMKIRFRVVHTQANCFGLYLFYAKLSNLDKQNLDTILEKESSNI